MEKITPLGCPWAHQKLLPNWFISENQNGGAQGADDRRAAPAAALFQFLAFLSLIYSSHWCGIMQQNGCSARAGLNLKVPPRRLLLLHAVQKDGKNNARRVESRLACTQTRDIYIYAKHNRLQLLIMQDAAVKFLFRPDLCGAHWSFGNYGNLDCSRGSHQYGY